MLDLFDHTNLLKLDIWLKPFAHLRIATYGAFTS